MRQYRPCQEIGPLQSVTGNHEPPVQAQPNADTPPLMVSDNPEVVCPSNVGDISQGVLWEQTVNPVSLACCDYLPQNRTGHHRIFLWHLNRTVDVNGDSANTVALLIQSLGAQITVSNVRVATCDPPIEPNPLGRHLAYRLLAGLPQSIYPSAGPFTALAGSLSNPGTPTQLVGLPWLFTQIRGAQIDITLNTTTAYRLSVVFGIADPAGTIIPTFALDDPPCIYWGDPPCPTYEYKFSGHPREAWPYSEASQTFNYFTTQGTSAYEIHPAPYVFTARPDSELCDCACTPSPCERWNRAPYGAIMHLYVTITNDVCTGTLFNLYLESWAPQATSFGAVRFNGNVDVTGEMNPKTQQGYLINYQGPLFVPAYGQMTYQVDWAVAGGATTPIALVVQPIESVP